MWPPIRRILSTTGASAGRRNDGMNGLERLERAMAAVPMDGGPFLHAFRAMDPADWTRDQCVHAAVEMLLDDAGGVAPDPDDRAVQRRTVALTNRLIEEHNRAVRRGSTGNARFAKERRITPSQKARLRVAARRRAQDTPPRPRNI